MAADLESDPYLIRLNIILVSRKEGFSPGDILLSKRLRC